MDFGSVNIVISQPQLPANMPVSPIEQKLQQEKDEVDKVREQMRNVAEAIWFDYDRTENGFLVLMPGRKTEAFLNTWGDTWLAKGINYFKYDRAFFRKEDPEFKKTFTDEEQLKFLIENHLGLEHANEIRKAKNYDHALDLATTIKKKERENYEISNALTDREHFWSSMATGLADVDVILGVVLVILLLNWLLALKKRGQKKREKRGQATFI